MIAALPMYDHPALADDHDTLWAAIADRLERAGIKPVPTSLTRGGDIWRQWMNPDLVLGQTSALPYRQVLHSRVKLVGTFDYGLPDMPAGFYTSHIVVRANEKRKDPIKFDRSALAFNGDDSHSGWHAARLWAQRHRISLLPKTRTGSHRQSLVALAEGRADIASIDAVTWRTLERFDNVTEGIRILDRTPSSPGLPLICASAFNASVIHAAVQLALPEVDKNVLERLGIRQLLNIPAETYLVGQDTVKI